MKTSEFIKMLQEADPSGEAHIRMEGGVPFAAELKPGYWDGPYSYIDDDGSWNYSTEANKVDIHCTDIDDFVYDQVNTYRIPTWEEIAAKFKFSLGYSIESQRKERENPILKSAKKSYDSAVEMNRRFETEGEARALENAQKGWTWFQNKLVDDESLRPNMHHYYTWKVYDESGKDQGSNLYNVQSVYKSGLFERHDNGVKEGYYQWIKK
jgi:hypothetical protein